MTQKNKDNEPKTPTPNVCKNYSPIKECVLYDGFCVCFNSNGLHYGRCFGCSNFVLKEETPKKVIIEDNDLCESHLIKGNGCKGCSNVDCFERISKTI